TTFAPGSGRQSLRPSTLPQAGAGVHLTRTSPVLVSPTPAPRAVISASVWRAHTLASMFVGVVLLSGCTKAAGPGVQQQGQAAPPPPQVGIVTVSPATIAEPYELG